MSSEAAEKPGLLVSLTFGYLVPELLAEVETIFRVFVQEAEFANSGDRQWPEISAAIISGPDRFLDAKGLDRLPNLRVVANHGVGIDHLDQALFKSRGIIVTNTPGVIADSTADVALMLLLNCARRQRPVFDKIRTQVSSSTDVPLGNNLAGSTVGIVGLGSIGQGIARRCGLGFGCRLYYHQRRRAEPDLERQLGGVEYCPSLADLLPKCDFVVLSCPLTAETRGMINAETLRLMRPTSMLVNIARGGVVDTDALLAALRSGLIAGAGLDVTDPEPLPPSHPLLQEGDLNVWVTPHIGTHTLEGRRSMLWKCVEQICAALRGETPSAAIFTL